MSGHEIISECMILPTGMDRNDYEMEIFSVKVQYRGEFAGKSGGGYRVFRGGIQELSKSGVWGIPERFRRWQYRWEHFEDAMEAARQVVDDVVINSATYAQWQEYKRTGDKEAFQAIREENRRRVQQQ